LGINRVSQPEHSIVQASSCGAIGMLLPQPGQATRTVGTSGLAAFGAVAGWRTSGGACAHAGAGLDGLGSGIGVARTVGWGVGAGAGTWRRWPHLMQVPFPPTASGEAVITVLQTGQANLSMIGRPRLLIVSHCGHRQPEFASAAPIPAFRSLFFGLGVQFLNHAGIVALDERPQ
jgi:hypothetical protein